MQNTAYDVVLLIENNVVDVLSLYILYDLFIPICRNSFSTFLWYFGKNILEIFLSLVSLGEQVAHLCHSNYLCDSILFFLLVCRNTSMKEKVNAC